MLFMFLSGLFGGVFTFFCSKKGGFETKHVMYIMLFGFFGMDIGARALFALTILPSVIKSGAQIDFNTLFGGMVFYGGMLGSVLGGFIYTKINRLNFLEYADLFAPGMVLCHAIGRIGCYLAGCCYGFDCNFTLLGIKHTHFPLSLVEAFLLFVLFAVLCKIKAKKPGDIMRLYLVAYAVTRFVLEFFRGDEIRGRLLFFSTSQWISLAVIIWAVFYHLNSLKKKTE